MTNEQVIGGLLSLCCWPGLGQLVKGDVGKFIIFSICFLGAAASTLILIGFVLAPVVWLWSVYDAFTA
jgi:TM2 domain-containing membrane protein YozV